MGNGVVGSPGIRAGDTLNRLKDDPNDALALLAVKGRLDQLHNSLFTSLYTSRNRDEVYPTKVHLMGGNLQIILTRIDLN